MRCLDNSSLPFAQTKDKCLSSIMRQTFTTKTFECYIFKLIREGKEVLHYKIFSNNLNNIDNKYSQNKLSWIEAPNMCKDAGALLPYFTSQQDLDNLIRFLKQSDMLFILEGLFIALVYNTNNNKVKLFLQLLHKQVFPK